MFRKNSISNIIDMLIIATIISIMLPVLSNNLPFGIGSTRFFWGPLTLLSIFLIKNDVFRKKIILFVVFYGLLIVLFLLEVIWVNANPWYRSSIRDEYYNVFLSIIIMTYLISCQKLKLWAMIGKLSLFLFFITAIMTIIATSFYPNIVRDSIGGHYGTFELKIFEKFGSMGYGYTQALMALFPSIIFLAQKKSMAIRYKLLLYFLLTLFVLAIIRTQIFANIMIGIISILLSLLGWQFVRNNMLIIGIILILLLFLPIEVYSMLFNNLSEVFPDDSNLRLKLHDFSIYILNPDFSVTSEAGSRASRYPLLLEAFFASPILGDASYNSAFDKTMHSGAHLYWMSRLTLMGVPAFMFFLIFYYILIANVSKLYNKEFKFYYNISILSIIILGMLKNLEGREMFITVFVIIPGLFFLSENFGSLVPLRVSNNNNVK